MNREQQPATGTKTQNTESRRDDPVAVVGIGSSAGGLEALTQFFTAMPDDSGLAFVLVSHLDPHHDSMLPELIQNKTRMKVSQVTDAMKVGANRIYVIPPAKELVNQTPVGIFVLTDRLFSYINPAGRELLGMAASDRLIGSRFIDRVDRQFRDRVLAQLDTIRQEQAAATAMEERFLRMDGGSIGCEIFAAPISYKGRQSIVVYVRAKNGEAARTGGRQV